MINEYDPGMVKEQFKKEEIAYKRIRERIAWDRAGLILLFSTGVTKICAGCCLGVNTMVQRRHAHEY